MFSKIKGPLKRLARKIQARIRLGWRFLTNTNSRASSWAEAAILPRWRFLVSTIHTIRAIFRPAPKEPILDETTPLLEEQTADAESESESDSDDESVYSIPVRSGVPFKSLDIRVGPIFDLSSKPAPKTFYYSVDPYCVICRKEFHMDEGKFMAREEGKWDHDFIAICPAYIERSMKYFAVNLNVTQKEHTVLPPIGHFSNPPMLANIHVINPMLKPRKKDKPPVTPDANLRQAAYAVHRTCRGLAASGFEGQQINKLISHFGQSTKFLARTDCCEGTWKGSLRSLTPRFVDLDQTDDLAKLLHCLSRCPTEIEDQIRDLSTNTLLSAIINFFRTTFPFIQAMTSDGTEMQRLEFSTPFSYLEAHTITMYESTYIDSVAALDSQPTPTTSTSQIISTQDIQGIQFALGDYGSGVRALRVLYLDGTSSTWIGSSPRDELMTIVGTGISGLRLLSDNLKITGIDLIAERRWHVTCEPYSISGSPVEEQRRCYMLPSYIQSSSLPFPGWRISEQNSFRNRYFNNWQAGTYVSLHKAQQNSSYIIDFATGNHMCALTVYCLNNSVCGIAFYWPETLGVRKRMVEFIGTRSPMACAIHMELDPLEKLLHVLASSDAIKSEGHWGSVHCPPFIITTTHSRSLICSRMPLTRHPSKPVRYIKTYNPQNNLIGGFFTDGTANPDGSICNLGVAYLADSSLDALFPSLTSTEAGKKEVDKIKEQELNVPAFQSNDLPDTLKTAFVSVASFANVANISAHRRGDRIMGLRVKHFSGMAFEVLGQYDPSYASEIKTIFACEHHGTLCEINFTYTSKDKVGWGDAACEYVSNVSVRCDKNNRKGENDDADDRIIPIEKKTFTLSEEELKTQKVAWIFTRTDDHIQRWNEQDVQQIEVEEEGPRRELLLDPGLDVPERDFDKGFVLWDEHEVEIEGCDEWDEE